MPPELVGKTVYQPIVLTVSGTGAGAQVLPVLDTSVGSNIFVQTNDHAIIGYEPAETTTIPQSSFTTGTTTWNGKTIVGAVPNSANGTITLTFAPNPIYGATGYNVTGGGIVAAFKWNTGPNISSVNFVYNKNETSSATIMVSPKYIGDNETVQGPVLNSTRVKPCVICWSTAFSAGAYPGAKR